MSLQTPQAFTNRAYRFRVPNQIPASNPKNGSDTYRQAIQKNLAKTRAETTEGLSTLSQSQINRVKKANEGKFKENSRYVVKDKNPPETQPPSEKRKAHFEDDTESDEETPKAKRPCIRTPEDLGAEVPSLNEMTRVSTHGDTRENPYSDGAGVYDGENRNEEEIVLLFASIGDRYLALVQDQSFANPYAVMQAQENGHLQARQFGVHWYRRSTPRYVGPDGILVEDVVHATRAYEIVPDEHVPGVFQPTP